MKAVLGIDAAWTTKEPSGVALVEGDSTTWRVVKVAPSYGAFLDMSRGIESGLRTRKFAGSEPNISELCEAVRRMTPGELSVIAVDMPIATIPIDSRRQADSLISRAFGARGCSAHSPSAKRPGRLGTDLMSQLRDQGFPLATMAPGSTDPPCSIEVYPHPALLTLLEADYRVPYKVSRSTRYWKGESVRKRIARLLDTFGSISTGLGRVFGATPLHLPSEDEIETLTSLKRYEDMLDAIVCAWVGVRFLQEDVSPYGDDSAAIWVPR